VSSLEPVSSVSTDNNDVSAFTNDAYLPEDYYRSDDDITSSRLDDTDRLSPYNWDERDKRETIYDDEPQNSMVNKPR